MKGKTLKTTVILSCIVLIAALFAGCQSQKKVVPTEEKPKSSFPVTITDTEDIKVTVEKEPQKIVALAPSAVEILYKLGLGDRIVGVSEFCDYPEEAKSKPQLGGFQGPNLEKIIEAKPDIVFANTTMTKDMVQKLLDLNITVIASDARSLAQVPETYTMIGKVTGTEDKAKALVDDFNKKVEEIKSKVANANKVKAYYVISFGKDGNWTSGKGTFISDLINLSGGENIADDVDGWMEYSVEKIIEKNPEMIFVSSMIANGNNKILDNETGYKDTDAVKNGKVIIIDDNLTQRPGPRITEGLEILAESLHPEIFSK